MNAVIGAQVRETGAPGALLIVGIFLAALTEAIAGTALSLSRSDMIGDLHATPDEFAWLDVGYTALKFIGFVAAPWLGTRWNGRDLLLAAVLCMGLASALAAATARLEVLIALRMIQGLAGGILLVTGQALIFLIYPRARQPALQACFAIAAVVAPATVAPALQGWLVDHQSWSWIFLAIVPACLGAAGVLWMTPIPETPHAPRAFDGPGFALLALSLASLTQVLSQGSRWDWLEATRIRWWLAVGIIALLAFLLRQFSAKQPLLEFGIFRSRDFVFAFVVSFVAGAALFGSAYLIPAFAVAVLSFTATDAGLLLLPSGLLFVVALLIAAWLVQVRRLPPIATAPVGILLIMAAMWMLSGSTGDSGADDMMGAILLRGFGLGFLFLSITLIAFGELRNRWLADGIAVFNVGRQMGGLLGVAGLQTLIDHQIPGNLAALGANLTAGTPAVGARLAALGEVLAERGVDAAAAGRAASSLLARAASGQATVLAFDTAFLAVALSFIVAAPVVIAVKVLASRIGRNRS